MPLPHFVGIGAMKAGTSWLDQNLRQHPEVWMPPHKELRYFEKGMLQRKPKNNIRRLTKLRQPSVRSTFFKYPGWMLKFFLGKRTDTWYSSLFQPQKEQICGEISPDYAKLDEETIAHMHALMPDLKILFIMRNPIERAWSHILWDYCGGDGPHNLDKISLEKCIAHAESKSSRIRGDYLRTLRVFESQFSREQIFLAFFEEMTEHPEELMRRLYTFLGVDDSFVPDDVQKRVNANPGPEMPEGLREHLQNLYKNELGNLSRTLGGYAEKWLGDAQ